MDPQFQELASEIAVAVEKRLSGAFEERIKTHVDGAVEKRLSGDFEERIASKVEERLSGAFEERIKAHIDQFEQRADLRLKTHIDQFETRAEQRMQMHFENLEGVVKSVGEAYGGNLDRIEDELKDLNKKFDTKFGDHGAKRSRNTTNSER